MPEDVERVEERERLKVRAERYDVPPLEQAEVVGELPDVLIQDVVDRERLMADRRVRQAPIPDLDRGKVLAEGSAEIPEAVVAREEPVREAVRPAVQIQRERVQLVVDRVARLVERQAARVGPTARVPKAQHERVRRQVTLGLEVVVPEREVVARIDVPVDL